MLTHLFNIQYLIFNNVNIQEAVASWVWWCTPLVPMIGRQRQGDLCLEQPSLHSKCKDYTEKPSLGNKEEEEAAAATPTTKAKRLLGVWAI